VPTPVYFLPKILILWLLLIRNPQFYLKPSTVMWRNVAKQATLKSQSKSLIFPSFPRTYSFLEASKEPIFFEKLKFHSLNSTSHDQLDVTSCSSYFRQKQNKKVFIPSENLSIGITWISSEWVCFESMSK